MEGCRREPRRPCVNFNCILMISRSTRITVSHNRTIPSSTIMDLDRRVAALELRQNAMDQHLSGFLSPTSIKEVMLSLASSRRYRIIPLADMGDFGWTAATTHISLRPNTPLTPPPPVSEPTRATRHGPSRATALRSTTIAEASTGTPGASGLPARARCSGAGRVSLWKSVFGDAGSSMSPTATQRAVTSRQLLFSTLPKMSRAGTTRLAEAADLQPWLSNAIPCLDDTLWKVNWVDGHKHASIGTRKPDSVHYAHRDGDGDGAVRSVYNIAYIGDLKSQKESGSGDMVDDEIAHMLDFLGTLARVQTWRRSFVGYLLDGEYIVFLSATFDPSPALGEAPLLVRKGIRR